MNRSTFALFVALLIHLVILLLLWIFVTLHPLEREKKVEEKKVKISLKELPVTSKKSGLTKKEIPQQKSVAPPLPKGSQLKKIETKPPVKFEPTKPRKEPRLNKPTKSQTQPKKVAKTQELEPKKPYIPLKPQKEAKEKIAEKKPKSDDPFAWMHEDRSDQVSEESAKSTKGSNVSSDVEELYGEEFGKLTPGQQKYILDNQEIMRRITQQVLNRVARVNLDGSLRVNSSNVIEFYLHPNGDMSDFRFISKSGYFELDDITKETIEYAYAKYPRPSEKTLIRYNVFYHLGR